MLKLGNARVAAKCCCKVFYALFSPFV